MRWLAWDYMREASLGLVATASLLGAMAWLGATSYLCALASLAVTLAAFGASRALRRGDGRRALALAALPIQVALPAFYLASVHQLFGYFSRPPDYTCGNAGLVVPFLLVLFWWLGARASRFVVAAVAPRRGPVELGALRVAACVSAVGLLALAAHASYRARRLPDSPDGWVAAQPVVAEIPAVGVRTASSETRRAGDVCVERRCELSPASRLECRIRATPDCTREPIPERRGAQDDVPPESALRIRSARGLGAWLVEVSPDHGRSRDVLAFVGNPPAQVAYDGSDIASELAAPRGWIVGGFAASALALLLALTSRTRRPFDPAGWQEAWHEGSGRLRVGDVTAFATDVASLPAGDVIVRARQPGGQPFRTNAAVEAFEVAAGTLDDARTHADLNAAAPALLALSAAAAVGAPLVLAALLGLV